MAGGTDRLQVGRVEELHRVTMVGFDVVDHGGGDQITPFEMSLTQGVLCKLLSADALPAGALVQPAVALGLRTAAVVTLGRLHSGASPPNALLYPVVPTRQMWHQSAD